eukprot:Seg1345.7 transcript_id=Seg1345.7/GoldUCD/mRNA.D3Y31 product="V-type proton ATPase subunit G" protein_id=Seg1345.7/GoldUCD/D3Y31
MASQSQGIQQLLAAEKKAAELVAEARKRKTKRLKQAKEEAVADIEQYRGECEGKFREKQVNQQGKVDFQARINQETTDKLDSMGQQIQCHKNDVINRVLDLVYDIKPELHTNFRP